MTGHTLAWCWLMQHFGNYLDKNKPYSLVFSALIVIWRSTHQPLNWIALPLSWCLSPLPCSVGFRWPYGWKRGYRGPRLYWITRHNGTQWCLSDCIFLDAVFDLAKGDSGIHFLFTPSVKWCCFIFHSLCSLFDGWIYHQLCVLICLCHQFLQGSKGEPGERVRSEMVRVSDLVLHAKSEHNLL